MKKMVYFFIVLFFAISFFITGSAESAPKVIELKAATTTPPMAPPGAALTAWAKKFEEASGGRVKFTMYYASSLFPAADIMRSVLAGVADISDFWHIEGPQMFPLSSWGSMPGLDWTDPYEGTKVWREMIEEFPEFTKQYKGLKLVYPKLAGQATMFFNTREKPVKSVADLKGLKIIGHDYAAKWLKNLGATPVFVPYEDTYMSIERGIVDGHNAQWGWMEGSGTLELTPYHADTGIVGTLMFDLLVMNADSFNRLPPDIQKIFDDLDEFATKMRIDLEMAGQTKYVPISKNEWGHQYFKFSPEDSKALLDAAKPLHEELIELGEKQGVPARKFYETLMRKIEAMR